MVVRIEHHRMGDPKNTTDRVDGQRPYKGRGGNIGMLRTAGTQAAVNSKRPGTFKVRKKRY